MILNSDRANTEVFGGILYNVFRLRNVLENIFFSSTAGACSSPVFLGGFCKVTLPL
jgi:hypothetical protein